MGDVLRLELRFRGMAMHSGVGQRWVQLAALLRSGCVILSRSLSSPALHFLQWRGGKGHSFAPFVCPSLCHIGQEGGALCLGKIASFILTFKNDVFSCLQGVPEALPKLLSEKPNPTHPGRVCTIPSWTWGPCSGVSAPLSLGLRPCIILDSACMSYRAYHVCGTSHDTIQNVLLKI